ncbi:MAG: aldo/keto reductase [Verrucomicrobiota bacterium]|jgi:aryl-alcohol dehydrogenase-like predicted oxidoreductase
MKENRMNRRQFVQTAAMAAAGATVGAAVIEQAAGAQEAAPGATRTRSYNANMEYRRLGRTGLMVSAVSIGGHWKQMPFADGSEDFKKNRREVMAACLDHGINYADACCAGEVLVYAEALGKNRDKIYFGFDWQGGRSPEIAGSLDKMKQQLDQGLREAKLEYVDLWRVTMREQTTRNTAKEIDTVMAALEWAKRTGKARFTGISTHHRPWIADAAAKYPQLEVIVTPYSAGSKEKPVGSMFEALRNHDVGFIGIKPFASGSVFKSGGRPDSATLQEDNDRARLALRYVLCCDVLSCAIPGLITVDQVKNAAAAVKERRQFDVAETERFDALVAEMWAKLPENYQWLRHWEWV